MKTFMLYLNNEFQDGSTNFVDEKQNLFKVTLYFRYRLIISKWTNWQQSNIRGSDLHKMLVICYQIPFCYIYFDSSKICIESFGKDLTMGIGILTLPEYMFLNPAFLFTCFIFWPFVLFCLYVCILLFLYHSYALKSILIHDVFVLNKTIKKKDLSNSLIQYYGEID